MADQFITVTVKGPNMAQVFAQLYQDTQAATVMALNAELHYLLAQSQELVPVETGALKATGEVIGPNIIAGEPQGSISYGDETVDYALVVHEDLTAQHPHGGQAKYLETPVNQAAGSGASEARMAAQIRQIVAGMSGR